MNSFDNFTLSGANTTRYILILGNAASIIGAFRRVAEAIETGQTPLFLLDGELSTQLLSRAIEKLRLTAYVAIYRPFDVKLKKRLEELKANCHSAGFVKKDGTVQEWVLDDKHLAETTDDEFIRYHKTGPIKTYLAYEKALVEYASAISRPPIDAATGNAITGDVNEYLYERAKTMYPLGVESILETNIKQSAIPKHRFFVDGIENAPAPKGVRQCRQDVKHISLFDRDIDDTIAELRSFFRHSIGQNGAVTLPEILTHCAEIGLYKGNITLYAIGAAFRDFNKENAIFYDGVAYWRYTEVQDISSWILRVYDILKPRRIKGKICYPQRKEFESAMFFDNTTLKQRMEYMFGIEPTRDKRLDTLGMAIVQIGAWITNNLHYPIAFLDNTLHHLFRERILYGEKLQQYDAYFTAERCEWIKARIPDNDAIARRSIIETVGFDPDITDHGMSRLPKGHYAPILYSAEDYIKEMLRKPRIAI